MSTCLGTRPRTPRASFLPQKLQHFIVGYLRGNHAENLGVTEQAIRIQPVLVILSELTFNRKLKEPFEHVNVSIPRSSVCCLVVNTLVSVVPEPFQYIQTAHRCGIVLPVQESTCISLQFISTEYRRLSKVPHSFNIPCRIRVMLVKPQIVVIRTRIQTRYGACAQELDGRQLVHDVPALFVHSRESEVVFNLELRQDLRIEQAGNLADQSTE